MEMTLCNQRLDTLKTEFKYHCKYYKDMTNIQKSKGGTREGVLLNDRKKTEDNK